MKFDKNHKVIIDTLNKDEAKHYIDFLVREKHRHGDEVDTCTENVFTLQRLIIISEFWQSAIRRHKEDIMDIDCLIKTVKEKFEL